MYLNQKYKPQKLEAFNLQEMLVALVIVGIVTLIAIPIFMPKITQAKALEAKIQLKYIHSNQTLYHYMYSKYSTDFNDLDFESPKTVLESGTSNYSYEILSSTNTEFVARATAVVDFDGDGIYNVWEINENGIPKQITKD